MAESKLLKHNNSCPITNSSNLATYLDLGNMPLVNNLCATKEESLTCNKYPLAVQYCNDSGLSMLTHIVDPTELYSNYYYKSGISLPYIEHCKELFQHINKITDISSNQSILDIGGNDGTLLETFLGLNSNLNVLNVDASSNLTNICTNTKNIPSVNDFWNLELAKKLDRKFNAIISTNVFQHTEYCNEFTEAIALSLADDAIWCLEFPWWDNSVATNQFDQVYHEHLYYYNIESLRMLFKKYGLKIISFNFLNIHGGTLRLVITKNIFPADEVDFQKSLTLEDYIQWGIKIKTHISNSKKYLVDLKEKGYKIAGFGAAAKGCIFLNSAGIDHTIIDYVVDDTDIKQGKYIPGTGIQVVGREKLKEQPVDYIIILAHNFVDYISRSLTSYEGKMIVFFPEIKTI